MDVDSLVDNDFEKVAEEVAALCANLEILFPIGARVVLSAPHCQENEIQHGETGTVLDHRPYGAYVGVCWDKYKYARHDLDDKCKNGHGWWVKASLLQLCAEPEDDNSFDGVGDLL